MLIKRMCTRVCVRARACVRVGMGLVITCLRVSCGAPPRPFALDPLLYAGCRLSIYLAILLCCQLRYNKGTSCFTVLSHKQI